MLIAVTLLDILLQNCNAFYYHMLVYGYGHGYSFGYGYGYSYGIDK